MNKATPLGAAPAFLSLGMLPTYSMVMATVYVALEHEKVSGLPDEAHSRREHNAWAAGKRQRCRRRDESGNDAMARIAARRAELTPYPASKKAE
jgi:hypothetical protein